ncbi:antitoxin [Actinomycetospora straminea]|uniref:Antitoxin protein of toxin-antitoxin system n=1 Tax=Actinomycetospora straminea TaxID=663607 RepID=A0ABP9DY62_9PSEU|nr:antitoxin [Actinomycetospora straminea]MDD7930913.1 antitoxin [Actinomycetospora straminea]
MVDFGKMVDKAKDWAGKNPDKADAYVDKGTDAVGQRFGHEQQVDQAGDRAKQFLHGDQAPGQPHEGQAPPPPDGQAPPPPEGQAPPPPPPGEEPPRP